MQLSRTNSTDVLTLICHYPDGCDVVLLTNGTNSITYHQETFSVTVLDQKAYIRFPSCFEQSGRIALTLNEPISIRMQSNQEIAKFWLEPVTIYENELITLRANEDRIHIGTGDSDDLRMESNIFLPAQFQINFKTKTILDSIDSHSGYLNHHRMEEETHWQLGDHLQIGSLNLSLFEHGLVFQRSNRIETSLPVETIRTEVLTFPKPKSIRSQFRRFEFQPSYSEKLERPISISKPNQRPLIFNMGPSLTMSMASSISASIAVYNGYLNGRELIDLLPMILLPGVMVVSTLLWMPAQRLYDILHRRKSIRVRNDQYGQYLKEVEERCMHAKEEFRSICAASISTSLLPVENTVYTKSQRDADFGYLQLGRGSSIYPIQLIQDFKLEENDPIHQEIGELNTRLRSNAEETPIYLALFAYKQIVVDVPHSFHWFLMRILPVLNTHNPESIQVVILCSDRWSQRNMWIRRIPHTWISSSGIRAIATTRKDASFLSTQCSKQSHVLVLALESQIVEPCEWENATIVRFDRSGVVVGDNTCVIRQDSHTYILEDAQHSIPFTPDQTSVPELDWIQALQRYVWENSVYIQRTIDPSFFDLFGIQSVQQLDIARNWSRNHCRDSISATIGQNAIGEPIELDLSERGHGPHGLIAGSTGSGKSELIITLLLGLAVRYSPRELQFVFIDFKGGGAAEVFSNARYHLPHIAGVVSNLDSSSIERSLVSLFRECKRREMLFKQAGNQWKESISNLDLYQTYYRAETGFPYLAHLLIVVDEFAEMKKEYPEFLDELITLARVGRSLGIHLILSTQKPTGVVNDQIWSNSRFKICLKVQEKQDSMELLHRADASTLKDPGEFCLLVDSKLTKGRCGYSGKAIVETHAVDLMDCMGRNEQTIQSGRIESDTQLKVTLQKLIGLDVPAAEPLWLEEVETVRWEDTNGGIAILDDYYHRERIPWVLDPNRYTNTIVFSLNRDEKIRFLQAYLYQILNNTNDQDEVFLCEDLQMKLDTLFEFPQFCACYSAMDLERVQNTCLHLSKRNPNSNNQAIWILDDYSTFKEIPEEIQQNVRSLLESSEICKVHLLVFANSYDAVPYRIQNLMGEKVALTNGNLADLSAIFSTPVKKRITQRNSGILRREHILTFQFPDTSLEDFLRIPHDPTQRKAYQLPYLPDQIQMEVDSNQSILIGMDIKNYESIRISKEEVVMVLATYEDELQSFTRVLSNHFQKWVWLEESNDVEIPADARFLCMTFETWQRSHSRVRNLLYIGSGFSDQYRFTCSRKHLDENQGVYYLNGRSRVIQIAEI